MTVPVFGDEGDDERECVRTTEKDDDIQIGGSQGSVGYVVLLS